MSGGGQGREFERIARLFRPLASGAPGAFDLLDDAAALPSRPGCDLILTKDALVSGVHFLPDDPPDLVARKLLRVNLSDLAAKGATPEGYLLALAWPDGMDEAGQAGFASGLAEDQAAFGLQLLGGDTVATSGPWTLSCTMVGWTPSRGMVRRADARAGDLLYVSGTIGDGALGLHAARGELDARLSPEQVAALAGRYRLPEPRLELRDALRAHASACADISDGLLADAMHIAEASGAGLEIALDRLPLSDAAAAWLKGESDLAAALLRLATGGDDYELACAVPAARAAAFEAGAAHAGTPVAAVGAFTARPGLRASVRGQAVQPSALGWEH